MAALNVAQPSLSAQLRALERLLGFALFERTSRHVALTREGRLFLPEAQRMLAEAGRLARAARDIHRNDLRLGAAVYSTLIPERVRLTHAFMAAHPDVQVRIDNLNQAVQFRALRRGEIDIALTIGLAAREGDDPGVDRLSEIVLPGDFDRLDLIRRPIRLLVPAESPLAAEKSIPLPALAGQRIATLGAFHGSELIDAITAPLEAAGAHLIVPPEGNAIAVERYGMTMRLPAIAIGWFDTGDTAGKSGMVLRDIAGFDVETRFALLRLRRDEHRPAPDAFWAFAATQALEAGERAPATP